MSERTEHVFVATDEVLEANVFAPMSGCVLALDCSDAEPATSKSRNYLGLRFWVCCLFNLAMPFEQP
jgi:hypothetical protein